MHKLMEMNYIEWHRRDEQNDYVRDYLLTHLSSIDLLQASPMMLIMV